MTLVENTHHDPYLSGLYAPIDREIDQPDLPVTGRVPEALVGSYVRNGPNPMFEPKGRYHVFDGDGMLHGVGLEAGRASYQNRWVRTEGLAIEQRAGRAIYGGMANADFPDPADLDGGPTIKNVANTNVVRHAGRTLCLWEAGLPTEVSWDLDTIGTFDFGGEYTGPFTAHPKLDARTGEMCTFGYGIDIGYRVIDAAGRVVHHAQIPLPRPVMMHDFMMTEDYVVFLDAPAVFDFGAFTTGEPMLQWKPDCGTRLGVLPRRGQADDIVWVEIDNCYVFHFLNAWNDDNTIVIDGSRLSRMDIGLDAEDGTAAAEGTLHRFTIDLAARTATVERIGELPGDFPRVAPHFEGYRNRYGYVATFSSGESHMGEFDSVTKHDFVNDTQRTRVYGPHHVAGEAVFAPDPDGTAEDDGWLLNFVTDKTTLTTDLVILDARDLSETAKVHLPQRVPFGFHGNWLTS
jgi:carotenoid cleavage dioxygenase